MGRIEYMSKEDIILEAQKTFDVVSTEGDYIQLSLKKKPTIYVILYAGYLDDKELTRGEFKRKIQTVLNTINDRHD